MKELSPNLLQNIGEDAFDLKIYKVYSIKECSMRHLY